MVISDVLAGAVIGFVIVALLGTVGCLFKDWLDDRIHDSMWRVVSATNKDFYNMQINIQALQTAQTDLEERVDLIEEELDGKDGDW